MNRKIGTIGASIVLATVILFAVCMLIPFNMGSYFVCIILPIGFVMMSATFCNECSKDRKAAAYTGMALAVIYAVLVLIVYFAQLTVVNFNMVSGEAMGILDFQKGGLLFNYDLLGYGIMALSTFFTGLTIDAKSNADKWLKCLLITHGIFFPVCLIMPITGFFTSMANESTSMGGVIALECWCAYFIPVAILSIIHFSKSNR